MSGEHYLHGWRRLRGWERILATNITDLLDWQSDISQQYPHLHNAFLDRFEDFMSKRYDEDRVSMCNHDFSGLSSMLHRADSYSFQKTDNHNNDPTIDNNQIYDQLWRYNNVCPSLLRRLEFYGIIGSGSKSLFLPSFNPAYGTVVLARERSPASHRGRFYAVKIEPHYTMENRARRGYAPAMTAIHDVDNEYYFISLEALLLLLTGASDRFMNLDSVYVENRLHMTVMSACVDYDILHKLDLNEGVPSFQGRYLWNNKKPILDELGGCKVSSQLLEAFAYLWDMNITHSDLSEMNFLVDENLNACLIDLGMTTFGFERQDFCNHFWAIIGSIERMITPELALELFKPYWKDKELHPSRHQVNILIPYDATIDDGWKLACIIYQIMHGFAAWESPESKNQVDNPMHGIDMLGYGNMSDENGAYETMIYERRDRVINEELPIDENLSQDCADALRIMLQKKPLDRPSFTERYSFPWFNQWASYQDQVFLRPYSESYEDSRMHRGVLSCPSYGPLEP